MMEQVREIEDSICEQTSEASNTKVLTLEDLKMVRSLGRRGKFGSVYLARLKESGFIVVLKVLDKEKMEKGFQNKDVRENQIQSRLSHKNVLRMFHYFDYKTKIFYVLDYAVQGDVYRSLKIVGRFDEITSAIYLKQLTGAIKYLHDSDVIQKNIKLENTFDTTREIKIANFGMPVLSSSLERQALYGTLHYLAPKVFKDEVYDSTLDLMSLLIWCLEILVGNPTIEFETVSETYRRIKTMALHFPEHATALARDFIQAKNKSCGMEQLTEIEDSACEQTSEASKILNFRKMLTLEDFEIVPRPLGRRRKFGNFYLARLKESGFIVVLKVHDKEKMVEKGLQNQIVQEIEIHSRLRHKNIIEMFHCFYDESRIYYVLEYAAEGDVYKSLQTVGRFDEITAAGYMKQLAGAIKYLHDRDIIHMNIKPENLFLDTNGKIKISNFGMSVLSSSLERKTLCGTLDYLAPEMIEGEVYDLTLDLWCLGVLCYEFLVGKPPFEVEKISETMRRIIAVDLHFPEHVSALARDFIQALLKRKPEERLTLDDMLTHKWILTNVDTFNEENTPLKEDWIEF